MRPGARTNSWFDPPSHDAIRSGLRFAASRWSGGTTLREVSTRTPFARARPPSARNQSGGVSWSSATSHSRPAIHPANSSRSGRFTWTWVALRSVTRRSRERSVNSAWSGGKSRPW